MVRRRRRRAKPAAEPVAPRTGFEPDRIQRRVLESTSRQVILNCCRQWGKSTVTATKAVKHAVKKAESLTLVVSPSGRQSGEFLRKAEGVARAMGLQTRGDGDNEISLVLPNGARIVGLPGNEATTRGFSAVDLLVVDEASRVSDDYYLALRPVLAVSGGEVWLLSTPHGQRGFFWETWEAGGEDWERIRVTAEECPRISADFLRKERALMSDRLFRQEYMCEFTDCDDGLFGPDLISGLVRWDVKPLSL